MTYTFAQSVITLLFFFSFWFMQASKRAFTLVELLVVITILAIISVVAYTSFGGATDKAKNSTKLNHIATIETALNSFNQRYSYYPLPSIQSTTNLWGYDNTQNALTGNTLTVTKTNNEITAVPTALGGGKVMNLANSAQIGAKGVMDSSVLSKEFLSSDLYDPMLKDTKVVLPTGDKTLANYGIGKYVYAVYAKNQSNWTTEEQKGAAYNLAVTITDDSKNEFAKITGNFDSKFTGCGNTCPNTLIGPGGSTASLKDGDAAAPYDVTP